MSMTGPNGLPILPSDGAVTADPTCTCTSCGAEHSRDFIRLAPQELENIGALVEESLELLYPQEHLVPVAEAIARLEGVREMVDGVFDTEMPSYVAQREAETEQEAVAAGAAG